VTVQIYSLARRAHVTKTGAVEGDIHENDHTYSA
jgi:hypothetical protein